MKIGWSTDFIIVDGEKCAADELDRLRGSSAEWVLIERDGGAIGVGLGLTVAALVFSLMAEFPLGTSALYRLVARAQVR